MAATRQKPKLIVIVGPTASGKSELAMRVAQKYGGEIIAADSRTIYQGANIGTSKPSDIDRAKVPHWGLDLIEPGQTYSAKAFKDYALDRIKDIQSRKRLPILVGGTGLYIDSVIYDFGFRPKASPALRKQLEAKSIEELHQAIGQKGYQLPTNPLNKRHLIRTIEAKGAAAPLGQAPLTDTLIVGLDPEKARHQARIAARAEAMFSSGVLEETKKLMRAYGRRATAELGVVYRLCLEVLEKKLSQAEAIELFKTRDWQYSRRQRTWLRRNKKILWFNSTDEAEAFIDKVMNT